MNSTWLPFVTHSLHNFYAEERNKLEGYSSKLAWESLGNPLDTLKTRHKILTKSFFVLRNYVETHIIIIIVVVVNIIIISCCCCCGSTEYIIIIQ